MACFIVPVTEAVITTAATHIVKHNEKAEADKNTNCEDTCKAAPKVALSTKLGWLNKLLWGGSALLAFEHFWHGEVSPVFPFLTAVANGESAGMLAEMSTTGVAMAVAVTAVWLGMVGVTALIEKKADNTASENV